MSWKDHEYDHGTYVPRDRRRSPVCFLAQFSERPCDGQLIRAHLVSRQVLKRLYRFNPSAAAEAIDDPRSWVPACGGPMGNAGHHGMLDASRTLRVPREALPAGLEDFASELGLTWWLEREYGPLERAA